MIPRYQKILFGALLVASVAMGTILWQLRERAHERLIAGQDSAPTQAPEVAPAEQATLMVANDSDGSLMPQTHSLPLPADPEARAQALLGSLLDLYAAPDATHPVSGGAGSVLQVFLLPAPAFGGFVSANNQPKSLAPGAGTSMGGGKDSGGTGFSASGSGGAASSAAVVPGSPSADDEQTGPQLAVVNLSGGFANNHPSGIETEMLTLLSICDTLHANLPRIAQVRFLVDGQPRPTLAGHMDLTRTYLTDDAAQTEGPQP